MIFFLTQSAIQSIIWFWIFQDFIWLSFGSCCKWSFRSGSIFAKLFNIAWKLPSLLSSLSSLSTSLWPHSAKPCWAHSVTASMIRFSTWTFLSLFCHIFVTFLLFGVVVNVFLGSSNDTAKLSARVTFSLWYAFIVICSLEHAL